MLFNFRLRPLDQVTPWGAPEKPTLQWFGLTDGEYWIQSSETVIFAPLDYQVVRLHEDLLTIAPHALDPVPDDLHRHLAGLARAYCRNGAASSLRRRIDSILDAVPAVLHRYVIPLIKARGRKEIEKKFHLKLSGAAEGNPNDDFIFDLVEQATSWVHRRELDTSYLVGGPALVFWSDAADVRLAWSRGNDSNGVQAFSREFFTNELVSFHNRLMTEMEVRIDAVINGALQKSIHVDVPGLLHDQEMRRREIEPALRSPDPATDWEAIRAAIREVEAMTI